MRRSSVQTVNENKSQTNTLFHAMNNVYIHLQMTFYLLFIKISTQKMLFRDP